MHVLEREVQVDYPGAVEPVQKLPLCLYVFSVMVPQHQVLIHHFQSIALTSVFLHDLDNLHRGLLLRVLGSSEAVAR